MGLAKELNNFFKNRSETDQQDLSGFLYECSDDETLKALTDKFGEVTTVYDGREGYEYDQQVKVYSFAKYPGEFVAVTGYYSSYDGSDWIDAKFYAVRETEKTIKVYTKI